jgi:hypothetical protein
MARMGHSMPAPALILGPFVLGTVGCLLLLRAGRSYVRGRLESARALGRRAGWLLLAGDASVALLAAVAVLGGYDAPSWVGLGGAALFGAAGWVGWIGGLAGKPRPADLFAALLHVAGAVFLIAAA